MSRPSSRRRFLTLRVKLVYFSVALVSSLSVLMVHGLQSLSVTSSTERADEQLARIVDRVQALRRMEASADESTEACRRFLQRVGNRPQYSVLALFDARGRVVVDEGSAPPSRELQDALKAFGRHNELPRLQRVLGASELIQVPLLGGGGSPRHGFLLVARDDARRRAQQRIEADRARMIGLGVGVLGGLFAFLLSSTLTRPLYELIRGARSLAGAREPARIETTRRGEVGALAQAFNRMASSILDMREKLAERSRSLESTVHRRTVDMSDVLANLAEEQAHKVTFLSSLSHELRTPLTTILADLEILTTIAPDDPEAHRELIPGILESCDRLERILEKLVYLLVLESRERPVPVLPFDLRAALTDGLERCSSDDVERVRFEGEVLQPILGDRAMMSRVSAELISNALRFSPAGSPVRVLLHDSGEAVSIVIEDEGEGIAPEDRINAMRKFGQVGDVLVNKPDGAGLGLPICVEIARQLRARFDVGESESGGCRCHFELARRHPCDSTDLAPSVEGSQTIREKSPTGSER